MTLNTSDAQCGVERASGRKIEILSHDTMFRKLETGQVPLNRSLVIVDEFHVQNCASISLNKLLLSLTVSTNLHVLSLSATTAEQLHKRTNFSITTTVCHTLKGALTALNI